MALYFIDVIPTNDAPERQFGDTGMIIASQRNRLCNDIIATGIGPKGWMREGVIIDNQQT
jgi:hypothetical protein